jgi:hypothetical protein
MSTSTMWPIWSGAASRIAAAAVITHRHYQVAARIRAFPDYIPTPLAAGIAATHRRDGLG